MRIFLTGGTGLIGRQITKCLIDRGDTPVILSRQSDRARLNPALRGAEIVQGDPAVPGSWETVVDGCDAVINLVGHNIFANRWSDDIKKSIRDSRVIGTEHVVEAMARASNRPKVLVQASAIGYYGPTGDEDLIESSPSGADFMAGVCGEWEAAAKPVESLGVRVSTIRTGVVLAPGAGALGVMTPIFKWVPGGAAPVGSGGIKWYDRFAPDRYHPRLRKLDSLMPASGRQWLSWIHVKDIAGLFMLALDNPQASGPMNGTAPNPVRNFEFSKELARAVHRRWVHLPFGPPDAVLQTILGEVANIVVTGQKVLPTKAQSLGYSFQFPELRAALAQLFAKPTHAGTARPKPVAVGAAG